MKLSSFNLFLFTTFFIVVILSLISFTSASQFTYNSQDGPEIISGSNYSINVNNTNYFQGYTPITLKDYFQTFYNSVYYSIANPYGFYNSTTLDLSSYIPYNGANQNVNLGNNNFTVDNKSFIVNQNRNRIGIRTTDLTKTFNVAGNIRFVPQVPSAPTATLAGAGAGSLGNGAYRYAVVFVTDEGDSGATSTGYSNTITIVNNATDGKIQLTNIPIGDEYVTARKIYRTTAGGNIFLLWRVTTINNNVDTTYLDNVADGALVTADPYYRKPDQTAGLMYYGENKIFETGAFNTFTGLAAGRAITTGNSNSFYGAAAGQSMKTGSSDNLFGYSAGQSMVDGSGNNCVGYSCLLYNDGDRNSALGGNALRSDPTAGVLTSSDNEAFGDSSLYGSKFAISGNIGIGRYAGYLIGTTAVAANNIIIGTHNTTAKVDGGDYNILIGYNAAPPTNATNYFLNIGDLIKGVMSGSKYVKIEGDIKQDDSKKIYQGSSDDVSFQFTGTDENITAEVGSPNLNINMNGGQTNIDGNFNQVNGNSTINMIYGEMYANNVVQTVVISSPDVYYEITNGLSGGLMNGFAFNNNYSMNNSLSGIYKIDWHISAKTTSVANKEVEGTIMINGVAQNKSTSHAEVSPGGSNRPETISGTGLFQLNANSEVSLAISNHIDTTNIVVEHISITAMRVGN